MKRWQNILVQVLGTIASTGSVAAQLSGNGMFGGGKTTAIIVAVSSLAQALAANIAHGSNPDGTPATTAYVPEVKK